MIIAQLEFTALISLSILFCAFAGLDARVEKTKPENLFDVCRIHRSVAWV
jgi:hypothetical protein